MKTLLTIGLGAMFSYVLIASGAFHWYRIQEMFHFDSFHMYGLLSSAILTAGISVWFIKRVGLKSLSGKLIQPEQKERQPVGNIAGGFIFGIGWGLTGACTAPLFILAGLQWQIGLLILAGALVGTLAFGCVKSKLPK